MNLTFIGTSSGETSLKRDHSSILIDTENSKVLIDCGDGIAKALLKQNIEYNSIDAVVFTHYHADHFSGIAALITQMKLKERAQELKIFTHKNLVEPLEQFLTASYLFKEALDFELIIVGFDFEKEYSVDDEIKFEAKQNSHIQNKHDVELIPQDRFVSLSLLFSIRDIKILYTGDIAHKEDLFLFDVRHPKFYITETTHIDRDWVHGIISYYHPQKLYLTHISDEDEPKVEKHLRNQTFPQTTEVLMAEDGHSVTLF